MWGVCRRDECELNSEDGLASWGVTSARNEHEHLHGQKRLPAAYQRVMHLTCLEIAVLFHSRRQRSFSRLALEASQPVCPVAAHTVLLRWVDFWIWGGRKHISPHLYSLQLRDGRPGPGESSPSSYSILVLSCAASCLGATRTGSQSFLLFLKQTHDPSKA